MRFPLRKRLFVPYEPVRAQANFHDNLRCAVAEARRFIARKSYSPASITTWQNAVAVRELEYHDLNQTLASAVLGVTYGIVANAIIPLGVAGQVAHQLGTEGQRRMVVALLELHPKDRARYVRPNDPQIERLVVGARSVARVAAALSERNVLCYLPTNEEDARLSIDLLCETLRGGGCLQIKTGAPGVNRNTKDGDTINERLLNGTSHFNRRYSLKWDPITVGVPTHGIDDAALLDGRIRRLADNIITVIQSTNA